MRGEPVVGRLFLAAAILLAAVPASSAPPAPPALPAAPTPPAVVLPARAPTPSNLGFEEGAPGEVPTGWGLSRPFREDGWKAEIVEGEVVEGAQALRLFCPAGKSAQGWAAFAQVIDGKPWRGRKIVLTGFVKSDGPTSGASLWLRVDRANGEMGLFDNGMARSVKGTDWTPFFVEGRVDADAELIAFGAIVTGTGGFFDALRIYPAD